MVLLEAVSLGIPVIASDIEENREVVGHDGMYFRSGDADDLREKMKWVIEHKEDRSSNAKLLQEYVHINYSWDKITDQYFQVYKEMVCN